MNPVSSYYYPTTATTTAYRDHDRYYTGGRPLSPETRSRLLREQADRSLRRDRSLDRLDRLRASYPYTVRQSSTHTHTHTHTRLTALCPGLPG